MSTQTIMPGVAPVALPSELQPITLQQFAQMHEAGVFAEDDRVELVHGQLVIHMAPNEPHASIVNELRESIDAMRPSGWCCRQENTVEIGQNRVMPDIVIVRGRQRDYRTRFPGPADVALIIEVADTSMRYDLSTKRDLYAAAGVPVYWVIDLPGKQVHVLTDPRDGAYQTSHSFNGDAQIDVQLAGQSIGSLKASDFLPA